MADNSAFVIPQKCTIPKGAYGVWQVPEFDIMIPIYQANSSNVQKIVDKTYAASIQQFGIGRIIADHGNSLSVNKIGKWDVCEFKPNTVAFLVTAKTTYSYASKMVCRAKRYAHYFTYDNQQLWPKVSTDICCISCVSADAKEVYFAAFKYTGKMKT